MKRLFRFDFFGNKLTVWHFSLYHNQKFHQVHQEGFTKILRTYPKQITKLVKIIVCWIQVKQVTYLTNRQTKKEQEDLRKNANSLHPNYTGTFVNKILCLGDEQQRNSLISLQVDDTAPKIISHLV